jgi:hypothetical protein
VNATIIAEALRKLGPVTIVPLPGGGWSVDDGITTATATGLLNALNALAAKRRKNTAHQNDS